MLFTLGLYYILGSLVDMAAFTQGVVGVASVPSAGVRIVVGAICLLVAARLTRQAAVEPL